MGKVWDEMQSARIEAHTHPIEPTSDIKYQLYERACVTVTATSREELFKAGMAKLDKLFGKDYYLITEVLYDVDGNIVNGTMYATYIGEAI